MEKQDVLQTRLQVPACSEYARIVRMLAAHTAVMQDFDIEAVEELRLAAEEAFVIACASDVAQTRVIDIEITLLNDGIQFIYGLGAASPVARDDEHEMVLTFARIIMEDAVDVVEVRPSQTGDFELCLIKRVKRLEAAGE